jgi:hypothetical protein
MFLFGDPSYRLSPGYRVYDRFILYLVEELAYVSPCDRCVSIEISDPIADFFYS